MPALALGPPSSPSIARPLWAHQPYILSLPTSILFCAIAIFAAVRLVKRSRASAVSAMKGSEEEKSTMAKNWEEKPAETRPYAPPQPWESMNFTQSPIQSFSPTFPPYPMSSSFPPSFASLPQPTLSQEPTETSGRQSMADFAPPRRRSYTKNLPAEGEVEVNMQGEIMIGDGWRRHTRVYGGGVCLACLESEKKMKEVGMSQS